MNIIPLFYLFILLKFLFIFLHELRDDDDDDAFQVHVYKPNKVEIIYDFLSNEVVQGRLNER